MSGGTTNGPRTRATPALTRAGVRASRRARLAHRAGARYSASWYGRPAVVFPVRDQAGNLVAAQGRLIDGRTPKVLSAGPIGAGTTGRRAHRPTGRVRRPVRPHPAGTGNSRPRRGRPHLFQNRPATGGQREDRQRAHLQHAAEDRYREPRRAGPARPAHRAFSTILIGFPPQ